MRIEAPFVALGISLASAVPALAQSGVEAPAAPPCSRCRLPWSRPPPICRACLRSCTPISRSSARPHDHDERDRGRRCGCRPWLPVGWSGDRRVHRTCQVLARDDGRLRRADRRGARLDHGDHGHLRRRLCRRRGRRRAHRVNRTLVVRALASPPCRRLPAGRAAGMPPRHLSPEPNGMRPSAAEDIADRSRAAIASSALGVSGEGIGATTKPAPVRIVVLPGQPTGAARRKARSAAC